MLCPFTDLDIELITDYHFVIALKTFNNISIAVASAAEQDIPCRISSKISSRFPYRLKSRIPGQIIKMSIIACWMILLSEYSASQQA